MAEAKRQWYLANSDHQKARVKENRIHTTVENRGRVLVYLRDHPCVDCGESDPVVLQFDHRGAKRANIARMLKDGFTWRQIEDEIAKCDVRCGNCHRRKTAREQGYHDAKHAFMKVLESGPRILGPIIDGGRAVSSTDRAGAF